MTYDPVKAHDYYMRTRELKGRKKAAGVTPKKSVSSPLSGGAVAKARAKVVRLQGKVNSLQRALTETLNAISEKRRNAAKTEKKNSDGKTTAKERQAAKEYRDKNKAKIDAKRKAETKKSGGSGGGSSSSSNSVSSMSVGELVTRANKIRSVLRVAQSQLSAAQQALGELAHAELMHSGAHLEPMTPTPSISRKDSVKMTADFSGYATRNNLRCSDGRTILADAFKEDDGQIVPLVWQHGHDEPTNVLGHVKLENVDDGVRAHAFFNSTAAGLHAKEMVKHGDVKFLSIYANNLIEKVKDGLKAVVHGRIREVSLVLAGANPGAFIDHVNLAHAYGGEDYVEDEAFISTGLEIELSHADTDTDVLEHDGLQAVLDTFSAEQMKALNYLLSQALTVGSDAVQHGDTDADAVVVENDEAEVEAPADEAEVEADAEEDSDAENDADADTDSDSDASEADADGEGDEGEDEDASTDEDTDAGDDAVQHNNQEDDSMTHNVFDQAKKGAAPAHEQVTLSHSDVQGIIQSAVKGGSLKAAIEDYALQHGIENIDYLFPDARTLESSPAFVSRRMEWVDNVLSKVRKSPFSRIKTITADITPDEARARGYIKGNLKNEEYFAMAKRETTPQTIYKKQKLDRDDVIDITELDVVAWLKAEMKVMLDEELAGAILIGDGRSVGDDDKIKENNIRPIASDAELYVTTVNVNLDDASSSVEELVDAVIENRRYYKGSGQPTFYTTEAMISKFLTVKDNFGRRIYSSIADVAATIRVADIVPVEVMERVPDVVGIMVNLADYTLGADRGGQATMFDDFDIDYNKLRYLIETRVSGALTLPKSAVVFRKVAGSSALVTPTAPTFVDNVVTVPTVSGVTYKDGDGVTLTTGSPVTLAEGEELDVQAFPNSGKYFANDANDEWHYEYQA